VDSCPMRRCGRFFALGMLVGASLISGTSTASAASRPRADAAAAEAAKSSEEILADVNVALQGVHSVALRRTQFDGDQRVSLNVVAGEGRGGGVMFVNGAQVHLVLAAPDVYIKSDKAGWSSFAQSTPAVSELLADRWIRDTVGDEGFGGLANLL